MTRRSLVVMGVSGSGKSRVGRLLAAVLGATFLEGDGFHPPENIARMSAGIALTDADRAGWLAAIAARLGEARQRGEAVVVACSALKRRYRDLLRDADPDLVFVYLSGDRELIDRRLHAAPRPLHAGQPARQPVSRPRAAGRRRARDHLRHPADARADLRPGRRGARRTLLTGRGRLAAVASSERPRAALRTILRRVRHASHRRAWRASRRGRLSRAGCISAMAHRPPGCRGTIPQPHPEDDPCQQPSPRSGCAPGLPRSRCSRCSA